MQRKPKNAIIIAVDIRGFAALCNKIGLKKTGKFIDEYFSIVRNALDKVTEREGEVVIDRFLGDGFLIFIFDEDKGSVKAVESALDIKNTFQKKITTEYNFTNAGVGIAIGKGEILYGKFGEECSKNSLVCPVNWQGETTGIGIPINETFRMLYISARNQILVSEEIRNEIRNDYIWTELDSIHVKGVRKPMIPYMILRKGKWEEEKRHCNLCREHCKNHKYCEKNYNFGQANRRSSVYVQDKWELSQKVLCDQREDGKGMCCDGCGINLLTLTDPTKEGCHINYLRGMQRKLSERICCSDCERYFTCQFNLHRGKNHTPKNSYQEERKRYCCEICDYFNQPEIDCLENRMIK